MKNLNRVLRFLIFIPVFIISFLVIGYLINDLIYPAIEWIAAFLIRGLISEFPENRLPENIVWWMLIFRVAGSAIQFAGSAYLSAIVYPNKNKKPIILSLIILNTIVIIFCIVQFNIEFPNISLLTLNNILIFLGAIVGYFFSYAITSED